MPPEPVAPPQPATAPAAPAPAQPAPAAPPKAPEPSPAAAPAGDGVAAAKEALEAAGGEAPEQKKGESDAAYEVRLSKLQRELRIARSEIEKGKADRAELERLRGEMEKAKNRRLTKREYVQLTKDLNAGKVQLDDDQVAQLPPELRQEIEDLKRWRQEQDAERTSRAQEAQRVKEVGIVRDHLAATKDELPLFEGVDGIEEQLLDAWYEEYLSSGQDEASRVKPDLSKVLASIHDGLAQTVARALQSESARRFLVGLNPDLKALLGEQQAKTGGPQRSDQGSGTGNGPRSLSNALTQDAPAKPLPKTGRLSEEDERIEASRAAYEEYRRSVAGS